jgi:SAM-dependent methyltransferase
MTTVTLCPICNGTTFSSFLTCVDHAVSKEKFFLEQCSTCTMLVTMPQPAEEELAKYYQSTNYVSHASKATNLIDALYFLTRTFTLKKKRALVSNLQPLKGNLLDVGCGAGDFLFGCLRDGWNVTGIEPNETAQALSIKKGIHTVQSIHQAKGRYDVITFWHALEHMPDLNKTMMTTYGLLRDNGTLLIAVPNRTSFDAKKYKTDWAGYDVPRHLWHFNQQNMGQLLLKHKFVLQSILPLPLDAFYVSLLSETYRGKKLTKFARAFITGVHSTLAALKTNEYSSLIYLAHK